jgi:hypothetical protein
MRRSTVLSVLPQLVIPDLIHKGLDFDFVLFLSSILSNLNLTLNDRKNFEVKNLNYYLGPIF